MSDVDSPLVSPEAPRDESVEPTYLAVDAAAEVASSAPSTPQQHTITRTVAIIKHHALQHRFDIEPRILEAGFEIVKERQMEFDVETDPDTLYEIFGSDAESLGEGPVWVYVLERRRAVEVWNTLMGDSDPEVARKTSPSSLRALYGHSHAQNGIMGSSDAQTAELQIAALFASSPPFPTSELPEDVGYDAHAQYNNTNTNTTRSVSSSVLSALRRTTHTSDAGHSTASQERIVSASGKVSFRARPLPPTHLAPDIAPRQTKAALLRASGHHSPGGTMVVGTSTPRAPPTKEQLARTFANVPGHKRATPIAVASTAPPAIAPRMTRAASLRQGKDVAPAPMRRSTSTSGSARPPAVATPAKTSTNSFEGVPGHKRRESIQVASTQTPTVVPRMNRSAALRATKEAAPPSSFQFRSPTQPKTPGLSRSNSQTSLSGARGAPSRPASAASMTHSSTGRLSLSRTTSRASNTQASAEEKATFEGVPGHKRRETIAVASTQTPTVAPKTNRSAVLRAAKMALSAAGSNGSKAKARPLFT
ncbi:hypothetical protein PLICRDRAFT_55694 [Plicaturopsis crispa FD-325 SS-3]|nr:hypothetical protein PLICRDRAFT_55694 [Plicaturopsis crispa FD-325 SS-3]